EAETSVGRMKIPSPNKRGCGLGLISAAVAALSGGVYLMTKWPTLNGAGKTAGVMLIVIGTLMLMPFLFVLAVKIVLRVFFQKLVKDIANASKDVMKAGSDLVEQNKAMYGQLHDFRDA